MISTFLTPPPTLRFDLSRPPQLVCSNAPAHLHCIISHHPIGTEYQDASCCLELGSNWAHDWLSNAVVGRFASGLYFYRRVPFGVPPWWRWLLALFRPKSITLTHTLSLPLCSRSLEMRRKFLIFFYNLSWGPNFQQQTCRPPSGFQDNFWRDENNEKAKPSRCLAV